MSTNDKWKRWQEYQTTGKWPETVAQQKAREAKEREQAHPVASQQLADAPKVENAPQEDHVAKVVRLWWEAHPHLK
jgi:archaellum component FlaD/FlaE